MGGALAILLLALTASGCGSSGGSSGTSNGAGGSYSISPTALSFAVHGGDPLPPPQNVMVETAEASVFLKTTISGAAVTSATVQVTGGKTAVVAVQAASPAMMPDGASTATVSIIGCADVVCSSEVDGSPKLVTVTYTKSAGGLTGMPGMLAFTQALGDAAPSPHTIALDDLGARSSAWTSSISYGSGSGWLAVNPSSGATLPATVSASVTSLPNPGTYDATIQFAEGTASVFDVAVTYTVTTISNNFEVTPDSLNAVGTFGQLSTQPISLTDGQGGSYPWTIQVEYPTNDLSGWVTPTPASGSSLPATVDLSLAALPDRATHYATVHVQAAGTERLVQMTYRTP